MKQVFLLFSLFATVNLSAQTPVGLPTCTGYDAGLIYFTYQYQIYNYDPALPISSTNPWPNTIGAPISAGGIIAVGKNIYAATPSVTFYEVSTGNNFFWHNGTSWVNSGFGFVPGTLPSNGYDWGYTVSGNFLYSLIDSVPTASSQILKNTSVGNGAFLSNVPVMVSNSPSNLAGDAMGDFFILNSSGTNGSLNEYNSAGNLISSWTASIPANADFAHAYIGIIGTTVYVSSYANSVPIREVWKGTLSGSNFNFTLLDTTSVTVLAASETSTTCPTSNALVPLPASVSNMKARDFKLFPNPANNDLTIVTENHSYNSFAITDIKGSIMTEGQMNNTQTTINIKTLAPGNYFIKLMGEGSTNVQQFVKN